MKKTLLPCAAALLFSACDHYPSHSVIVNSEDALVETTYGTNLAQKGVVLVSINHRLNFLGYLDLFLLSK